MSTILKGLSVIFLIIVIAWLFTSCNENPGAFGFAGKGSTIPTPNKGGGTGGENGLPGPSGTQPPPPADGSQTPTSELPSSDSPEPPQNGGINPPGEPPTTGDGCVQAICYKPLVPSTTTTQPLKPGEQNVSSTRTTQLAPPALREKP